MAAMALARLVIPAMEGIDTSELLALGDETREELDFDMHFSMCPFRTSLLLNFLPHS